MSIRQPRRRANRRAPAGDPPDNPPAPAPEPSTLRTVGELAAFLADGEALGPEQAAARVNAARAAEPWGFSLKLVLRSQRSPFPAGLTAERFAAVAAWHSQPALAPWPYDPEWRPTAEHLAQGAALDLGGLTDALARAYVDLPESKPVSEPPTLLALRVMVGRGRDEFDLKVDPEFAPFTHELDALTVALLDRYGLSLGAEALNRARIDVAREHEMTATAADLLPFPVVARLLATSEPQPPPRTLTPRDQYIIEQREEGVEAWRIVEAIAKRPDWPPVKQATVYSVHRRWRESKCDRGGAPAT